MPIYEVQATYPLSTEQKSRLAQKLTHLHNTYFQTPSLFVNVKFLPSSALENEGDYFLAGKPVTPRSPNRILGYVRTGPSRTKEMWDGLALDIETAWYDVVNDRDDNRNGKNGNAGGLNGHSEHSDSDAKKLHWFSFVPIFGIRENGVKIPDSGGEGTWLKDNMAYFKEQANFHGDVRFQEMLKEVQEREDLKKFLE